MGDWGDWDSGGGNPIEDIERAARLIYRSTHRLATLPPAWVLRRLETARETARVAAAKRARNAAKRARRARRCS